MIENKLFVGGGLNQDVDDNFLKPNDWDYALNIRNTDRFEFSDGIISNVKGNTLVSYTLPATGTNKCIGNFANEQTGKYYSFIYNSAGYHSITEYTLKTNTLIKVLESKTDTDGIDILNFQPYELINGVSMIGGVYLYWTDGYNPPRGIDVQKSIDSNYTYYTDSVSISLAKQPPLDIITAAYGNDTNTKTASNRLKSQLFQFRYLYIYEDNTRSAWSTCSQVPLPVLEIQSSVGTSAYKNNNIVLNFNVGTQYVKKVEVAAQVKGVANIGNTQDWFTILSVDRSVLISDAKYKYNSGNNLATFTFYNDGLYESIDVRETDLLFDFVPLKAKTLDIVNGNVLVMGNNTEGYNNIAIDATFNVTYEQQSISTFSVTVPQYYSPNEAVFFGVPLEGDTIGVQYPDPDPPYMDLVYDYPVGPDTSGSLYDTLVGYANAITGIFFPQISAYTIEPYYDVALSGENYQVIWTWNDIPRLNYVQVTNNPLANTASSEQAYKTNSRYQFGIVYYDEFNRSTYVQTNDQCIVATSSWGATSGYSPQINWQIHHNAPSGFTTYQWVRSENLTHKNFIYAVATSSSGFGNGKYLQLNINSLSAYNVDNPDSILGYSYTPGDRCTVHRGSNGSWVTGYDVQVADYSVSGNNLIIQNGGAISVSASGTLIEIYTPKVRANTTQQQFFYEFGEVYSCTGGVHAVTSGIFSEGDIYTKNRVYAVPSGGQNTSDWPLEDPNFSDFYVSNYSSNGRVNVFAPQAKQLNLPTDIRFSDTYVPNTNINGLTRFYGDAYETYDRNNGSIQKLAVKDNYLVTFQELKTGYIPIAQSIIEDQGTGSQANVAISNKLLNKIRYYAGDYGIGTHPESFARFAGTLYFADPNRGEIIKLTQGLQPISMLGMDSYFANKLSAANISTNAKVIGSYDPRNDEYIIAFKFVSGGTNETIAFNEMINRWTTFYSFIPDCGGYIFNQYFTYQNGRMYTHNTNSTYNSFYGSTYPSVVQLTYNQSPMLIKSFIGVIQQGNSVWSAGDITTNLSQHSSLIAGDFAKKEGVWFASLLRDDTSTGGLLNGDNLKGNWIKLRLANAATDKIDLLSVDTRHIPSYQGIK